MTPKETFRLSGDWERWSETYLNGIRIGVQYAEIMNDLDRLKALDPESVIELRKVTEMLREK